MARRSRFWRFLTVSSLGIAAFCNSGCVHRRITVHSDPPGAQLLVEGERVGVTPASLDFDYYGTREFTLIKDGHETLTTMQKVQTPWYQIPPLDFISDNLLPFRVTNRHEFHYKLEPERVPRSEDIIERARSLRSESQIGSF